MGLFDGFPFVSKEERKRREKALTKRITPFGLDEQREKQKETLKELFSRKDVTDLMFAFYQAKDAYISKKEKDEEDEEGLEDKEAMLAAARRALNGIRWVDSRTAEIILRFVEIEAGITSLDEYPTAEDVLSSLSEE